jgi:predicted aldo/keto reductase-like oxidoreductase
MNAAAVGSARMGLGAAYGIDERGVEHAFAHGVRFFLWGALPKAGFGAGLRRLAQRHRESLRIAVQSYARNGYAVRLGVELLRFRLRTDYLDWLCLANWSTLPPADVVAAAVALQARGLVRNLMISCHHRPLFASLRQQPQWAGWMVRYNAAHRRAESEVFPLARGADRPAVIAYTALRWGTLLDPRYAPPGEPPLTAVEAYRFVLSDPAVDLCLAGPRNQEELAAALTALALGPLDAQGLERARRVGDAAYAHGRAQPPPQPRDVIRAVPELLKSIYRDGITEHLLSRFNR